MKYCREVLFQAHSQQTRTATRKADEQDVPSTDISFSHGRLVRKKARISYTETQSSVTPAPNAPIRVKNPINPAFFAYEFTLESIKEEIQIVERYFIAGKTFKTSKLKDFDHLIAFDRSLATLDNIPALSNLLREDIVEGDIALTEASIGTFHSPVHLFTLAAHIETAQKVESTGQLLYRFAIYAQLSFRCRLHHWASIQAPLLASWVFSVLVTRRELEKYSEGPLSQYLEYGRQLLHHLDQCRGPGRKRRSVSSTLDLFSLFPAAMGHVRAPIDATIALKSIANLPRGDKAFKDSRFRQTFISLFVNSLLQGFVYPTLKTQDRTDTGQPLRKQCDFDGWLARELPRWRLVAAFWNMAGRNSDIFWCSAIQNICFAPCPLLFASSEAKSQVLGKKNDPEDAEYNQLAHRLLNEEVLNAVSKLASISRQICSGASTKSFGVRSSKSRTQDYVKTSLFGLPSVALSSFTIDLRSVDAYLIHAFMGRNTTSTSSNVTKAILENPDWYQPKRADSQGHKTREFFNSHPDPFKSVDDVMNAISAWSTTDAYLHQKQKYSNTSIYGQPSSWIGGEKRFASQVQETWDASRRWSERPREANRLPTWQTMRKWIVSLHLHPFGSGLSLMHLCHDMADFHLCQPAEINDLGDLLSSTSRNTNPGSQEMLRRILPLDQNVDIGQLFAFVVTHLQSDEGVCPEVKAWFDPSPTNVEHLLCKVKRFESNGITIDKPKKDQHAIRNLSPTYSAGTKH
ncbi:hypothetical protein BT69DRAFT_1327326 [Atractiella rhizophila]|nr:hypothetical protein BT69DRAFT_1327326 [Atractiella rhizophila]